MLHYAKFIGLAIVVIMIWLTTNPNDSQSYFSSGLPKSTGTFVHGRAEGTWTWWYENGKKMTEGFFANGKRNGTWNTWYEDGTLKSTNIYTDDKLNGPQTQWYKNGNLKQFGNYKADKRNGIFQYYDTAGVLTEEKIFADGALVSKN